MAAFRNLLASSGVANSIHTQWLSPLSWHEFKVSMPRSQSTLISGAISTSMATPSTRTVVCSGMARTSCLARDHRANPAAQRTVFARSELATRRRRFGVNALWSEMLRPASGAMCYSVAHAAHRCARAAATRQSLPRPGRAWRAHRGDRSRSTGRHAGALAPRRLGRSGGQRSGYSSGRRRRCRGRGAWRLWHRRQRDPEIDARYRTVRLYLDSSAIVKLVQRETESEALRRYLRAHDGDERVSSDLARVEVVRSVLAGGPDAIAHARRQIARLHLVSLHLDLLERAATLASGSLLRTLDAIHLATAQLIGADLRAVLTYDTRMMEAADALGLRVASPK